MKKLSLVIPCYNEDKCLHIVYEAIQQIFSNLDISYEILFVDDGSKDNSIKILKELSANNNNINYISFSRNFGKEAAILAGISNCDSDFIIIMDCDMQDPPEIIPKMLEFAEKGCDIVRTYRTDRDGEPPIRSFFAHIFFKLMNKFSASPILDGTRDFCLLNRKAADAYKNIKEQNRFFKEAISWLGFNVYWLPYKNIGRVAGNSKWSFSKLFIYAIDCFLNFSQLPFILSGVAIITSCFLTILTGFLILFELPNRSYLVYLSLFLGLFNFLFIGIIGLYVGKIYKETKLRPHYIIKESSKVVF